MANTNEDDALVGIKYRTYKKCIRQLIIISLLLVLGFLFLNSVKGLALLLLGFYPFASSFFGIISNKPTKEQLVQLKKDSIDKKDLF